MNKPHIHFVGIGGIGMSGVAELLKNLNHKVSGSDISISKNTEKLKKLGIKIFTDHKKSNIDGAEIVVYTSAIKEDNLEIMRAKELSIPILRRAEILSQLMNFKKNIAIAGTHGKTTTTSILATILEENNMMPTYVIGGIVKNLKTHIKHGGKEIFLAEADESDGTFLFFNQNISLITNIDNDHMDFYKNRKHLEEVFKSFLDKMPREGISFLSYQDKSLVNMTKNLKREFKFFGFIEDNKNLFFGADNFEQKGGTSFFDVYVEGNKCGRFQINIPGKHNVLNALGAMSVAYFLGVKIEGIRQGILKFSGVERRFEKLYEKDSFTLFDDYAHHPTEIKKTLEAFNLCFKNKKVAIFEPHRYSRTKDCWEDFSRSFKLVDRVYILEIYKASENPIKGITSENLVLDINKNNKNKAVF